MGVEIPAEELRCFCDPQILDCETSKDLKPLDTIVGQERALKALDFGLGIRDLGFNIYVSGMPGTGRKTAVKRFLEEIAKDKPIPDDWVYVNNFQDNYRPRALSLPPGRAQEFKTDVENFVEHARTEIRKTFESEEYQTKRAATTQVMQQKRDELFKTINAEALQEGFIIQATPMGMATIPIKDGQPLKEEEFRLLSQEKQDEITDKQQKLKERLKEVGRQLMSLDKSAFQRLQELDREVASYTLDLQIEDLEEKYQDLPRIVNYLKDVRADMLDNLSLFRMDEQQKQQPAMEMPLPGGEESRFRKYKVNVLVDNSQLDGAPIVMELNPTYNNLFGRIEKESQFGAFFTDFTMIREGSLHRANGGYLILPVEEVLRNIFSWDSLKRAIRNKEIVIEEATERLGYMTTRGLMPESIPWDIKVILIGAPWLYYRMHELDEDYQELFKVKADFDTVMERTVENMRNYAAYVCTICEEEELRHFDKSGLARIVEHGCRLASHQDKLSSRFDEISNVIREANFYAGQEDAQYVGKEHVKRAIDEKFNRSSMIMEKTREMIDEGTIKIDVSGEALGQVNGLSVIDLGDISFGRPTRITTSIGLGREGLIDIEREAKLGGPLHTKGVMILSGYLAQRYAGNKPMSLSARLVFEQSYSGIDGDSASSTELYAILSALCGKPIKQSIAVTGSVNQKGEVQAIGGVNQKIEGFFDVCKVKGLSGEQGVMIPEANARNLMLSDEVVDAVRQGKFHIWKVGHIDEGIEVLTGVKAGKRKKNGEFEAGSINALVDKQIKKLAETLLEFSGPKKKKTTGRKARKKKTD